MTEFIAWWGAIVATVVLVWDIHKWQRDRAWLSIKAVVDLDGPQRGLHITIANRSGRTTTIQGLALANYRYLMPSMLMTWRTHRDLHELNLAVQVRASQEWPIVLQPGKTFETTATTIDTAERAFVERSHLMKSEDARNQYLHVRCSHRDSPYRVRVRPRSPFDGM